MPAARARTLLPRWVSVADTLVVVLLVLAAAVAVFGGHRHRFGTVALSIRSWDRLLALALVVGVARHWREKQAPLHARIATAVRAFVHAEAVRASALPFLATRGAVLIAGYLAVMTIGFTSPVLPFRVSFNEVVNLPARWDAQWYLRIARDGYSWSGNPEVMQPVVFFPALPVLMHAGAVVTGSLVHGGLLVSLAAFFVGLVYLYRLVEPVIGPSRATTALWLIGSYPFAVYFSAPYTESIYLAASVAAFFHLARDDDWASAGWGLLIGFCRPNGFLMVAPLALLVASRAYARRTIRLHDVVAVAAPLVGIIVFSAYLGWAFGDPLAWLKGQAAWGRGQLGLWDSLRTLVADRYVWVTRVGLYRYTTGQPFDFVHSLAAVLTLASIWPVWRVLGSPYATFVAVNVLPPLMTGSTMSIGRMTSVLFPMFVVMAALVPERHARALVTIGCVLQGVIAAAFFTWRDAY